MINGENRGMENNYYEQEINLKELFIYVLHHWRLFFSAIMIAAILFGGCKMVVILKQNDNQTYLREIETSNKIAGDIYNKKKLNLEKEINNIMLKIDNQENYMMQSAAMQLDPYKVDYASVDIYVDEKDNNIDSIINAYSLALKSGNVIEKISEQIHIEPVYLQELITVQNKFENSFNIINEKKFNNVGEITDESYSIGSGINNSQLVHLVVYATNVEQAKLIRDNLLEILQNEIYEEIAENIVIHNITLLNSGSGSTVDLNLADKQESAKNRLSQLAVMLDEKKVELDSLIKPEVVAVNTNIALKMGVKHAVLGAVLVAFLIAFIIVIKFFISTKVRSGREVRNRFEIRILGELPQVKEKRMFGFIDSWIDSLDRGIEEIPTDVVYKIITTYIQNHRKKIEHLLVLGCVSDEMLLPIIEELRRQMSTCKIESGSCILSNAQVIPLIPVCDGVILVEQKNKILLEVMEKEVEIVRNMGGEIIGCIMI